MELTAKTTKEFEMTSKALKIFFSLDLTLASDSDLEFLKSEFRGHDYALKKIKRELAHRNEKWLENYYKNSVGGVSIEKYTKAKANGTLKVIEL